MNLMQGVVTGIIVGLVVMAVEHKVYDRTFWSSRTKPSVTFDMPAGSDRPQRKTAAPDLADFKSIQDDFKRLVAERAKR